MRARIVLPVTFKVQLTVPVATFTFPIVSVNRFQVGTIEILGARSFAFSSASISGSSWGSWFGAEPFGPVQMLGGEQLTVTTQNLKIGNNTAVLIGYEDDFDLYDPTFISPASVATAAPTAPINATSTSIQIAASALTQTLVNPPAVGSLLKINFLQAEWLAAPGAGEVVFFSSTEAFDDLARFQSNSSISQDMHANLATFNPNGVLISNHVATALRAIVVYETWANVI